MVLLRLPFFPPSRAVIMMKDDGVSVHKVAQGKSTFVDSVPWKTQNFEDRLILILENAHVASVLILNDAVEQHYRKEKIIIRTFFDKANIIKRRLNVAFPSYPMRAAIPLKDSSKDGQTKEKKEGDGGQPYLFAAAPSTETFSRIVRSIRKTDCNFFGYGLLPIESSGMVKALSEKVFSKKKGIPKALWTILVGQHRGGGLRQIVIKSDELALTRVTPVDEPKPDLADVWATDVSNEVQATLSYLSRFGYSPEDGLNIIILGDKTYADLLDGAINVPCNFEALSPHQAASLLGISVAQDMTHEGNEHFSDDLHTAWAGKKLSLTLPLISREISDISGPRKLASIFMVVLSLGLGVALYLSSKEAMGIYEDSRNLEVSKAQYVEIERIYQEELARKAVFGIDLNVIKSSLEIDSRIQKQQFDILKILKTVSGELKNLRIDSFKFKNDGDVLQVLPVGSNDQLTRPASFELSFSFAGNVNPKDGNKEMDELNARLNEKLAPLGFKSEVSAPLQNLTYSGEVDREIGLTANLRSLSERYNSKILIQKVGHVQSSGQ